MLCSEKLWSRVLVLSRALSSVEQKWIIIMATVNEFSASLDDETLSGMLNYMDDEDEKNSRLEQKLLGKH